MENEETVQTEQPVNDVLDYASKSKIKGFDRLYEFLDVSKLETDEGKQALFEVLDTPGLFSRPTPIGQPTNGGPQRQKSADQLLAEAAAKARATGRPADAVAYSRLKRELNK